MSENVTTVIMSNNLLQTSIHCNAPGVWLPYTAIDQLLIALTNKDTDPVYSQVGETIYHSVPAYKPERISYRTKPQSLTLDLAQF